ncbi:hypothetical protein [Kingella oralis]|jgi:hypothetical protein|uniref:hypothetical protein n=1 Tax=Kingella oralis TaxID=505 RepID=UPI0034E4C344
MNMLPEQPDNQQELVREFLEYQKQELANKRAELNIRRDEIASNERIALATIAAQKEDFDKRGNVFASVSKSRLMLFGVVSLLIALVLICAMMTGNTEIALELIKIGGAVLLGYFAGLNRGKAQVLEKQRNTEE